MPRKKNNLRLIQQILLWIGVLLISISTFAFWNLINQIVSDILLLYGIINPYYQALAIIIFSIIIISTIAVIFKIKKLSPIKVIKDILRL